MYTEIPNSEETRDFGNDECGVDASLNFYEDNPNILYETSPYYFEN